MCQRIVTFLKSLPGIISGNRLCILMYHNISNNPIDQLAVSENRFIEQMDWLKQHEYIILTLSQAINDIQNGKIRRKSIVLSFDDGYSDFLEIAVPILRKNSFAATLFVLAGEGGKVSYWKSSGIQEPLLSWDEIRRISEMGHEIGSHGLNHVDLTSLSHKDLNDEIFKSKKIIENKVNRPINAFCYPFGKHDMYVENMVCNAGYACAVRVGSSLANGPETNPYRLQRIKMEQRDSLSEFIKKVTKHKKLLGIVIQYIANKF